MTLGERCDEIVRLIDETLADVGIEVVGTGVVAGVTELSEAVPAPIARRRPSLSARTATTGLPRSA